MIGYGCDYKQCFIPEERHHECAAAGFGACTTWLSLQHQHTPRRSRGGKKCHVMLCAGHTSTIDNGQRYEGYRLKDAVEGGEWILRDRGTNEVLRRIQLGDE